MINGTRIIQKEKRKYFKIFTFVVGYEVMI